MGWLEQQIQLVTSRVEYLFRWLQDIQSQLRGVQQGLQAAFQQWGGNGGGSGSLARTKITIPGRIGLVAGVGTVTLQTTDSSGAITPGSDVTAFLYSATSVAAGKYCWLQQDSAGKWWIVSAEC